MTNGSNKIYLRNPETFEIVDTIEVFDNDGNPVELLNELEVVDEYAYINQWKTYNVIKFNIISKKIEKIYDFTQLVENNLSSSDLEIANTLNGIAYNRKNDTFYIAGKFYPKIFEVKLY